MRRIHAFELEDLSWFPTILRDAGTAFLRLGADRAGHADRIAPVVESALDRSGQRDIVDLCSGGGGPIVGVVARLRGAGRDVRLTLTDLFPNHGARRRARDDGHDHVTYETRSVDATAVPHDRRGLRTLFNALHHFRPRDATRILASAVEGGQPIAVVEVLQRRVLNTVGLLVMPLLVALAVPFLRPFRLAWLPLTYLVPVIPLFIWWDGTISSLRAYQPDELLAMARDADPDGRFDWRVEELRFPPNPSPGVALVGVPRAAEPPAATR